ncbi:M15 family metallopeptidase [Virgibacillus sp. 179-BFC.A HS]|uniref:M15 family metallopeptidase n=1 Tax=Tigheibacillus jepli TaxID=3035914 RepID=A0ABU5CKY4_9BACI|nr:M15 family metallopeptidase [Virgibacillus sp. 179-BFC.A HS]MDY0406980.1 M15 family metallopeptidase [Virgibacillus sp. 179-BFC.A HS]
MTDFQLQQKDLDITGMYDQQAKASIEKALHGAVDVDPGKALPHQDKPQKDDHGIVISNPYEILSLVNKSHALPTDFVPKDLVTPDVPFPFTEDLPKKQMRKPAANAMENMFAAAKKDGINLYAQSGYRSYERQEALFASYAEKDGEDAANKYSARPGQSEHQTGLTMDVTSPAIDFGIDERFADTKEGKWLAAHCADYGFIIRYPKGKEDITKYEYEAWHIRYVGEKAAKQIMKNHSTLEEYLKKLPK